MKCSHFSSNVDNVTQAVCNVRRPSPRHRQQRLEFEKEYFENDSLLTNDYLGFEQLNSILETRQQTAIDSIVPTMDHSQTVTKIHTHINPDALKSDTFLKPKLKKLSSNRIFDERINTTDLVETETYKHACASSTDRMTFGEKKIPKNDSQSKFRSPNFKNASNVISSTSKTTRSAGFSMADIAALKSKFPPNSRLALSHLRGTPDSNYKNTFTSGSKFSFSTIPTSNSCSIRKRSFSEAPYLDHQITSCDIQPVQNYSKGYNTFIQSSSDADLIESSFKSCDELESFLMHTSTNVQMNSNVERPFGMDEYLVDLKDQSDMNLTNHELWTNLQKPFKNQVNDEKYPMIPSSSVVEDLESLLFTSDTTEIKHSKPYMDFNLVDPKPSVNLNTQYIQKIDPIELDPNFGFRQEPRSFISLAPKIPNYKSTVPKAKTPPCLSDDQNKDKLNNPRKKTNIRIAPNVVTNTGYLAGSITTQKFSKALENFPGVARSLVSQDQLQYQAFLNSILNSNDGLKHNSEAPLEGNDFTEISDSEEDEIFEPAPESGDSDTGDHIGPISKEEIFELYKEGVEDLNSLHAANEKFYTPLTRNSSQGNLNKPATFGKNFRNAINFQINIHFQLLVQNLALSGEIDRASRIWITSLKLMIWMYQRLEALRAGKKMPYLCLEKANGGMEMLMRMIGNAGLQAKIFKDIGHPSKDQDLRNRSSIMMIPFRLKTKSISGPVLSSSFWHLLSIFGEPFYPPCSFIPRKNHSVVSSPVEKVLKNDCDMPMFTNDVEESHGLKLTKEYEKNPLNKTCEYTESQYTTVEIAEDGYNHPLPTSDGHYTWKPKFPCRVRVDSFVPVEDKLLLKGLQRYGIGNLEKIQTQYLPTRMLKQISTRIKNLTYRRTPSNPVKDFMTRTSNKLSIIEENMLMEAHKMCEGNWRMIKEKYLPKYPVAILQRLWTELNCEDESTVKNLK